MSVDPLTWLYALAVASVLGLTMVAAAAPQKLWLRVGALSLAGVLLASSFGALAELLSRTKPTTLEWARAAQETATVLAHAMREGEAIYLWLQLEDEVEPRAYALPWDEKQARQLHEAAQKAKASGTRVRMHRPFVASKMRTEPVFHAEPQAALPEKRMTQRFRQQQGTPAPTWSRPRQRP